LYKVTLLTWKVYFVKRERRSGALVFEEVVLKNNRTACLRIALIACALCAASLFGGDATQAFIFHSSPAQESFPAPPADRTLIYVADEKGALAPFAFEAGSTPLSVDKVAKGDKRSYVELKGANSATLITGSEPRIYLFLPDDGHAKPPFIVRLTEKRGARRVTAMAQKGYKGFAIDSEEIVKPHYRVLGKENGQLFMEIRTREPLMVGEYAIIGTDLQRIATFRVGAALN
jgi:hypothetical protein